jgi:hypothetical protein
LKTSAEVLEFEALRQLLGRYLSSAPGKRELDKLQPQADRARLEADLAEAAEAVEYLRLAARPQTGARGTAIRVDFNGLPDTETIIHKLRIEGAASSPKKSSPFSRCSTAPPTPSRCSPPSPRDSHASAGAPKPSAIFARC